MNSLMQLTKLTTLQMIDLGFVATLIALALYTIVISKAYSLLRGVLLLFLLFVIAFSFDLRVLIWTMNTFTPVLLIILVITFQQDVRRTIERIRKGKLFRPLAKDSTSKSPFIIKHILKTVDTLAQQKIGALIVIEGKDSLDTYIDSGILIKAKLSADVLASLFWPGAPTHDGAVILRESKIIAAGCLLPLTDSKLPDQRLGTRHIAAVGLSEVSDALVICISEETGSISTAENGNFTRFLNKEALEARLFNLYDEGEKGEDRSRD
jgi:diadenylate cyclase